MIRSLLYFLSFSILLIFPAFGHKTFAGKTRAELIHSSKESFNISEAKGFCPKWDGSPFKTDGDHSLADSSSAIYLADKQSNVDNTKREDATNILSVKKIKNPVSKKHAKKCCH